MIEQKIRSALLLLGGLLLSAGALGQATTFTQVADFRVTVASEYFGPGDGRVVTFDEQSQAAIRVNLADDPAVSGTGSLDVNNSRDITFTLTGATFDGAATVNNLLYYEDAALSGNISRQLKSGGARGDSSVTYTLTVETAITPAGGDDFLYFTLPALMVNPVRLNPPTEMTAMMGAAVVAKFEPGGRAGSNPFPTSILGSGTVPPGSVLMHVEGRVVTTASALATTGLGAASYTANVAVDNRKVIAATSGVRVPAAGGAMVRGLQVGALTIALSDPGAGQDLIRVLRTTGTAGGTPAITANGLDSSLNGTAEISVSGNFQTGDRVLLLPVQGATGGAPKSFEMDDGVMTTEVPIEATNGARAVVYVPGGVDDLTPGRQGTFTASLSLDFNDDRNKSGPVAPNGTSMGAIQLAGVTTKAYAYGVVRAGSSESSFLRIGCVNAPAATSMCNVYMTCYDNSGQVYFGGVNPIPDNQTMVFSSDDIAEALGGGWSDNRGRCDLMSDGSLEVQLMVRSGGTQVNNSVVIGSDGILDK